MLGLDPRRDRAELTQRLGVQLQDGQLPPRLQVAEALSLYSRFYRHPADWPALLDMLGLASQDRTPVGKLSGGQKQRLSIALALVGRPQVAVLDELTTGLDPQARRDTWELIERVRDQGVTIVLVTHFMEEAERLCDRIALIDAGRVAAIGTPAALTERAELEQQRFSFRPTGPFEDVLLTRLPEVSSVARQGDLVVVTGNADAPSMVIAELVQRRIMVRQLQVAKPGLEDAFLTLTAGGLARPRAQEVR